jgi:class 3 adenylate cyclase
MNHAAIGEIIIKYNGTLERYAGDGVMVVFNDPVPVENLALQAVLMALELRDALGALTATRSRLGHEIGCRMRYAAGGNINASADFTELACLFINMDVKSGAQQARRRREPANAIANYRD